MDLCNNALDNSYFTKDSFSVVNDPVRNTFLIIKFLPVEKYVFSVKVLKDDFVTTEIPGIYLESEEAYVREDFNLIIHAIYAWVDRIKEDLDSTPLKNRDIDLFLNKLRDSFLNYENDTTYFTRSEIIELNSKLELLETLILDKASIIKVSESIETSFKETLISIKNDLNKYQKNIWYTISGNKIVKEIKGVINYANLQEHNEFQDNIIKLLH